MLNNYKLLQAIDKNKVIYDEDAYPTQITISLIKHMRKFCKKEYKTRLSKIHIQIWIPVKWYIYLYCWIFSIKIYRICFNPTLSYKEYGILPFNDQYLILGEDDCLYSHYILGAC